MEANLTYKEAINAMGDGNKVKQGNYIYFLGKKERFTPYTLIMNKGSVPKVIPGFIEINRDGLFSLIENREGKADKRFIQSISRMERIKSDGTVITKLN